MRAFTDFDCGEPPSMRSREAGGGSHSKKGGHWDRPFLNFHVCAATPTATRRSW